MAPRVYPVPAGVLVAFVALFVVAAIALAWFTGDGASSLRDVEMPGTICPPLC
jgi:hypothetical protein